MHLPQWLYDGRMSMRLRSDPELAAAVERARSHAETAGELRSPDPLPESELTAEARDIVASWLGDGGYDRAVAEIAADDPDLADQ